MADERKLLAVWVSTDERKRLRKLAAERDTNMSELIRVALRKQYGIDVSSMPSVLQKRSK
jgi:hypothetical protein